MKPNEALAANLQTYFELNDITAHAIGRFGTISEEAVWSRLTGKVAPSNSTVQQVCSAVRIDAMIIQRKEHRAHQIRHSVRVGRIADDLMELDIDQLKTIGEMVKGLMPRQMSEYVPADLVVESSGDAPNDHKSEGGLPLAGCEKTAAA